MVNEVYPDIPWILDKNGELKKENFDACDSLICALAYININHHGLESPTIVDSNVEENEEVIQINYTTKIWNRQYNKMLILTKEKENHPE
jgi:hypothetical protein